MYHLPITGSTPPPLSTSLDTTSGFYNESTTVNGTSGTDYGISSDYETNSHYQTDSGRTEALTVDQTAGQTTEDELMGTVSQEADSSTQTQTEAITNKQTTVPNGGEEENGGDDSDANVGE